MKWIFIGHFHAAKSGGLKSISGKFRHLTARPRESGRAGRGEPFFAALALLHL